MVPLSPMALALALAASGSAAPAPAQEPAPPHALVAGDTLPAFEAEGLNGVTYTIDFPKNGPTTVLLVFLASCPHCRAMLPVWSQAFDKKPDGLKVQAIMLDRAPPGFFSFHKVSFPVLMALDRRDVSQKLKANRVPMTVRVKPGGIVEDVGQGELDAERLSQLFKASRG
ncbi:MAG TPA: redoxin family protein [Vicinamibacteria bacterium]|nr:redoxin family protein [Vicinamibacteria bacterium]